MGPLTSGPVKTKVSFDVLTYEAPFLMEKLLKNAIIDSIEEGEQLFKEVKKWLLFVRSDRSVPWQMYSLRIDEVWHQFVLFTNEYMKFCDRYFGSYIPHSPSNAPGAKEIDQPPAGSFEEFEQAYQSFFDMDLPDVWFDEKSVAVNRRVLNEHAGKLLLEEDGEGMINLTGSNGVIVFSINSFASDAMDFIASTKAFYVRELPGGLTDEEKIQLISTMIEFKILSVAS